MATNASGAYLPHADLFRDSYVSSLEQYKKLYTESIENNSVFWEKNAHELLHWQHDFQLVSDCDFSEGLVSWFLGGRLNACENCVDRHVRDKGDEVAIIWEPDEPGKEERITYKELQRKVSRLANVLRHNGITKRDRVAIYMPMIPEAVYAMLACAR